MLAETCVQGSISYLVRACSHLKKYNYIHILINLNEPFKINQVKINVILQMHNIKEWSNLKQRLINPLKTSGYFMYDQV